MNYIKDFLQFALYLIFLIPLSYVLGNYFAKVFQGEKHILTSAFGKVEAGIYKILGVAQDHQMNWINRKDFR